MILLCDFLDQIAKIHPSVRHEVEDNAFASEYVLGVHYLHRQVHFHDETLATFHLFFYDYPQVSLFTDVGGGRVADEFARLAAGEIDVAVIVVLYYLFPAQPELAALVGGKLAHEVAQFEASLGLYHDAAVYFGYSALMVLKEAERVHPAVSNQHVFLVLCLFGSCIGAFCH